MISRLNAHSELVLPWCIKPPGDAILCGARDGSSVRECWVIHIIAGITVSFVFFFLFWRAFTLLSIVAFAPREKETDWQRPRIALYTLRTQIWIYLPVLLKLPRCPTTIVSSTVFLPGVLSAVENPWHKHPRAHGRSGEKNNGGRQNWGSEEMDAKQNLEIWRPQC